MKLQWEFVSIAFVREAEIYLHLRSDKVESEMFPAVRSFPEKWLRLKQSR